MPPTRNHRLSRRWLVVLLGILAAVTGVYYLSDAFNLKSSGHMDGHTVEAIESLRRLFDASSAYVDAQVQAGIPFADLQFPETTNTTPALDAIAQICPSQHERLETERSLWESDPTWASLGFSRALDPQYYAYEYVSSGVGDSASFTVRAYGDLDCDGNLSTFFRTGRIANGRVEPVTQGVVTTGDDL